MNPVMDATNSAMALRLVSVNVGRPALLGVRRGKPIKSGIAKRPVTATVLSLSETNLEGDGQADLENHGGRDKAVYAYPADHFPAWADELGLPVGPAFFGENLTTAGLTEAEVRIGDTFAWGEALLQVSQPRFPCFKLAMHTGRPDLPDRLVASGRTGWYLRVLRAGRVFPAAPLRLVGRAAAGVTVLAAHRARLPGEDSRAIEAVLAAPALADSLRRELQKRLASG